MAKTDELEIYRDEVNKKAPVQNLGSILGLSQLPDPETEEIRRASILARIHAFQQSVSTEILKIIADHPEMPSAMKAFFETQPQRDKIKFAELLSIDLKPFLKMPQPENLEVTSMLDIQTLGLYKDDEIKQFLRLHYIDVDDPKDVLYLGKTFAEAIDYFNNHLINIPEGIQSVHPDFSKISKFSNIDPEIFSDLNDSAKQKVLNGITEIIFDIFKTTAGHGHHQLIKQTCAILRIAAVIEYINKDPRLKLVDLVDKELTEFGKKHVGWSNEKNSMVYTTNGDHSDENDKAHEIPIISFSTRSKERHRVVTKLLHKAKTSSSELSDPYGMRFVTQTAVGSLELIYYLFASIQRGVLPLMNVRPYRSRRRLENLGTILEEMEKVFKLPIAKREAAALTVVAHIAELKKENGHSVESGNGHNKNSSPAFQSLSITYDHEVHNGEFSGLVPVEIQIIPSEAYYANLAEAPHSDYEQRQINEVTTRIYHSNNIMAGFEESQNSKSGRGKLSAPSKAKTTRKSKKSHKLQKAQTEKTKPNNTKTTPKGNRGITNPFTKEDK